MRFSASGRFFTQFQYRLQFKEEPRRHWTEWGTERTFAAVAGEPVRRKRFGGSPYLVRRGVAHCAVRNRLNGRDFITRFLRFGHLREADPEVCGVVDQAVVGIGESEEHYDNEQYDNHDNHTSCWSVDSTLLRRRHRAVTASERAQTRRRALSVSLPFSHILTPSPDVPRRSGSMKPFSTFGSFLFGLIAVAHAIVIPMWPSVAIFIGLGLLSVLMWREASAG